MINDEDIVELTACFVDLINGSDLKDLMGDYSTQRTLAVKINGTNVQTGFILDGDEMRLLHDMDNPTVTATMDRNLYWNILNAVNSYEAELLLMRGVYVDEAITLHPPPGIHGGAVHLMNIIKIFKLITKNVIGE